MIVFVADYFKDQIVGGAEKNDDNLVQFFSNNALLSSKVNSSNLTVDFLKRNLDKLYVIGNFAGLSVDCKAFMSKNCNYIIYEHDYKFDKKRNPIDCKDFVLPKERLTNVNFYKSAYKVVCLSKLHLDIFAKNMPWLDNLHNTTCSLFSKENLDLLLELSKQDKESVVGVIDSANKIKKTKEAVLFCEKNKLDYRLFKDKDYKSFLQKMSKHDRLMVLSGHPEPTPRTAVEAKMLGVKILGNKKLIGVSYEDWWSLEGEDLYNFLNNHREKTCNQFLEWYNEL